MQKRTFLKGLAALIGATAAVELAGLGQAVPVALAYTPRPDTLSGTGRFFTRHQLLILRDICALAIPATDTPGAAEADVHGFIDNQLFFCHDAADQVRVSAVLARLDRIALGQFAAGFPDCTEQQQLELLNHLEMTGDGFNRTDSERFRFLKKLIVFGYYTSEAGASEELVYDAVPGGFKGSVAYDTVGATWGSLGFY